MSERKQHTSACMHENMGQRYGDEFHHKHDKRHLKYRLHWRSHPVTNLHKQEQPEIIKFQPDLLRTFKIKKTCKRLANTSIH
ncbi:MAG: hypothetical protein P1U39_08530 [Legionellaceae bacterium]|nr:hypothetical protein [Legionellaceae bacterium]